ncbi:MAG: hypothetical protein QF473_37320, partial [Planctomycetota bacterium]|nr:hypothetical protein [Planctomycetota bacterium]
FVLIFVFVLIYLPEQFEIKTKRKSQQSHVALDYYDLVNQKTLCWVMQIQSTCHYDDCLKRSPPNNRD